MMVLEMHQLFFASCPLPAEAEPPAQGTLAGQEQCCTTAVCPEPNTGPCWSG